MSTPFQFKQFTVAQNNTAMKVGTDGVLLGAWSTTTEGSILDIGTGTGLIALMLAQRTKTALIDAIEIEQEAHQQATKNILDSNWSTRINVHHSPIQHFKPSKKYELITSNPPFFINSTKSPNTERNAARHTGNRTFSDLIYAVTQLLKTTGIFSIILPITEAKQFILLAEAQKIYLNRECMIKPTPTKSTKRMMMEFSFRKTTVLKEELTIETETRHQYTKEYISLTQDFYLNF